MATLRFAALILLAACVGTEGPAPSSSGGTLVISAGATPDVLIPGVTASGLGNQISDLVLDRLAEIGDSLNIVGDRGFTPRLADRWSWSADSLSIAFHVNPRALARRSACARRRRPVHLREQPGFHDGVERLRASR